MALVVTVRFTYRGCGGVDGRKIVEESDKTGERKRPEQLRLRFGASALNVRRPTAVMQQPGRRPEVDQMALPDVFTATAIKQRCPDYQTASTWLSMLLAHLPGLYSNLRYLTDRGYDFR